MQYITTAERIGRKEGEKIGIEKGTKKGTKKGFLVGAIVMAQRFLKQPIYSQAELETKSLKELKRILAETEARLPSS